MKSGLQKRNKCAEQGLVKIMAWRFMAKRARMSWNHYSEVIKKVTQFRYFDLS